jgi:hypothetical protein
MSGVKKDTISTQTLEKRNITFKIRLIASLLTILIAQFTSTISYFYLSKKNIDINKDSIASIIEKNKITYLSVTSASYELGFL